MYTDFLIFGGAGLVGLQVCRHIAQQLEPRRIVVASLLESEAAAACATLEREFGARISFVPAWGNLFVPRELADTPRGKIINSPDLRKQLLGALYDDFEPAYQANHLVWLIRRHRPQVIVDCVNTATGLSYQDVWQGAAKVRGWLSGDGFAAQGVQDLEALLLSQSGPQIVRHVRFLHRATTEYKTSVYLKVGTTGSHGHMCEASPIAGERLAKYGHGSAEHDARRAEARTRTMELRARGAVPARRSGTPARCSW